LAIIAVTGATGFVGGHFCAAAAAAGHEVRSVPREILAGSDLAAMLRGADAVLHVAARVKHGVGGSHNGEDAFRRDNVELTDRIGDACLAAGTRRLVFVSSAGVLGRASPPSGFTDTSPPAPHDDYTRSKLEAEQLLKNRYGAALNIVVIRPPLVYGPGAKGSFARVMQLARSRWALPLGSMQAPRSLISVRNLCDLLLRAATGAEVEAPGLTLLAADAETTSVAELVALLRRAVGRPPGLIRVPAALIVAGLEIAGRRADVPGLSLPFVLEGTVAADRLGWTPPYRLADEIRWTATCSLGRSVAA
jgi:nucleoside-diphosphate-sugar epimerase